MQIGFLLLSGGKSIRMGRSKALLEWRGQTLLDSIACAGEAFSEKILCANDETIPTPKGFVRVKDIFFDCGPLGGIHAALCACKSDALVVAPCDAPFYSAALAEYLRSAFSEEMDALILTDRQGRPEPLFGIYAVSCIPVIEKHLHAGAYRLGFLLENLNTCYLPLPSVFSPHVLFNINTPQDASKAINLRIP